MVPTKEMIDALYREEVEAARQMSPGDKLFAGADLFDYACSITLSGIRNQFPEADEQRVHQILDERLALARRLENSR